ncbi:MAG: hypothetical protein HFJ75_10470, partial [Eggerthellaceae bacterium]|nr:hypothetical protein [Eggerthellaceae bacterium]
MAIDGGTGEGRAAPFEMRAVGESGDAQERRTAGERARTAPFDEEARRLSEVLAHVRAALGRADDLAEGTADGYEDAAAYLAGARGELAPEEAVSASIELDRMGRHAALAGDARERLRKLLDAPYFARVDFLPDDAAPGTRATPTYVGRFAFSAAGRSLVSDWRSPAAGLFYEFEPGPASFEAPSGRRVGTLALKRQLGVKAGQLEYAVDTGSSVRDEVLARALARGADARMHDIVASIQR